MQTFVVQSARHQIVYIVRIEGKIDRNEFLVLDAVRQLVIARSIGVESAFRDCSFDIPASLKSLTVMVFMVLLHDEVPKLVLIGSAVFDL